MLRQRQFDDQKRTKTNGRDSVPRRLFTPGRLVINHLLIISVQDLPTEQLARVEFGHGVTNCWPPTKSAFASLEDDNQLDYLSTGTRRGPRKRNEPHAYNKLQSLKLPSFAT